MEAATAAAGGAGSRATAGSVGRAAAPGRSLFYRMGPDPLHSLLAFLDLRSRPTRTNARASGSRRCGDSATPPL